MNGFNSHVPEYEIEEENNEIIITVSAPLSKPKEAALVLEGNTFTFDSPPYLLKVKLPHPVSDRFSEQSYDDDSKSYKVKFKKINGELESSSDEEEDIFLEDFQNDNCQLPSLNKGNQQFYGFANKYSNMFQQLYSEFSEIINLPNPDETNPKDRTKLRIQEENDKWSDDHYLADTMETDHLESIFNYKPPWNISVLSNKLDDDDKELILNLQKNTKCKNLSKKENKMIEFQLIDILYGFCYNKRTTEGDSTVESGWTINKISSTLSWFEVFKNPKSVLLSCYRRSLTYPLYRNWQLCQIIQKDVVNILKKGRELITKCLLEVRQIFDDSENRYLLNTLYLNDIICFAYQLSEKRTSKLAEDIEKIVIKKHEVNSDLPLLEIAAHLTVEEETKGSDNDPDKAIKDVVDKIGKLDLTKTSSSSDSEESDSDSESSQSSDKED